MTIKTTPFNVEDYLETQEDIIEFIKEMAENGTPKEFISSLGTVAKSKGMTKIAQETGLARQQLYKTLSEQGNPTIDTLFKVLKALNIKMTFEPIT